ncbi:MAG: DUF4386 domain-containing protein, partial [Gemmatimonadota bacterium]|nr:DUF4386 domain-containing protein [Gemmatimonadota bacterium]
RSIDDTQRSAARVVGASYLLAIPPALFTGIYVASQLVTGKNAAESAQWIMSHELLFRLGIASDLIAFTIDVALIAALYLVLKPVSRGLALFATFVRLVETALFFSVTLKYFDMLGYLGGADYTRALETDHLQSLARLAISSHNAGYNVGLVLAGLGSTVFCYLWSKSGYIPKWLAGFGVFASIMLAAFTFAWVIVPEYAKVITVGIYGGPIFLFELTMGCWLLLKPLRSQE